MVVEEVYNPIGIQHVPMIRTIESGGAFGIAEMFHGLYPNVDDMAKLSALIQNDGAHNGEQLLHREKLREALYKTSQQGLHSWWEDNQYAQSRYLYGFWSTPFGDGDNCLEQLPYMSGYGGNMFVILPNGMSLFRFSDSESYTPSNMVQASNSERAICG
jgi:CubicO group peptidase (beta-lactamase class C family)